MRVACRRRAGSGAAVGGANAIAGHAIKTHEEAAARAEAEAAARAEAEALKARLRAEKILLAELKTETAKAEALIKKLKETNKPK